MKSLAPSGFIAILLVSLCSCSAPSDTAQTPEQVPVDSKETRSSLENSQTDLRPQPKPEQPASIMARQLEDFGDEASSYAGDSFLETRTSLVDPATDEIFNSDEIDFSDRLNIK